MKWDRLVSSSALCGRDHHMLPPGDLASALVCVPGAENTGGLRGRAWLAPNLGPARQVVVQEQTERLGMTVPRGKARGRAFFFIRLVPLKIATMLSWKC